MVGLLEVVEYRVFGLFIGFTMGLEAQSKVAASDSDCMQ